MTKTFENCDMSETTFRNANMAKVIFNDVNLGEALFDNVNLANAVIRGANLKDMRIEDANTDGLVVNGFDINQLIEDEEDRRDPERVRLRMRDPHDPQCVQDMLSRLDEIREMFRERLRAAGPELVNRAPKPGRWCALEHVRHLLFAEDLYLNQFILQNEEPLNPMGMLPDFLIGWPQYQNVGSEPSDDLETVLAAWAEIHVAMLDFLSDMTPEMLRSASRDLTEEDGTRTVGDTLQQLALHDLQHIRWVESILDGFE